MKSINRILILVSFIFHFETGHSQNIPPQLDSLLVHALDSMYNVIDIKSLSAAIQFPDTTIWARATGISSIFPLADVTINDAYEIGSVTKTMTAACILQLADENILNLDDSLYQWLDTMEYINPHITIRQLLRHQSGLHDLLMNPACDVALQSNIDSVWEAEDLISNFLLSPLSEPGAMWSYCNTNYFLLGLIIKEATGNSFYQEIRNRFFTPLEMNTIGAPAFETYTSPVAHVWLDISGDGITDDAHDFFYNYLALNSAAGAAGCYYATPSDIAKWIRTYMRGDLLTPEMLTQAKTTVFASGLPGASYGLGLMKKNFVGLTGYGHGGDLGYSASSWYFPTKDLSITVHTNDSEHISWDLAPVVSALLKTICDYEALTGLSKEFEKDPLQLIVYPNPFKDQFILSMNVRQNLGQSKFVLTNILGEEIQVNEKMNLLQGNQTIAFDHLEILNSGMYFVTAFLNGNPVQTIKVTK